MNIYRQDAGFNSFIDYDNEILKLQALGFLPSSVWASTTVFFALTAAELSLLVSAPVVVRLNNPNIATANRFRSTVCMTDPLQWLSYSYCNGSSQAEFNLFLQYIKKAGLTTGFMVSASVACPIGHCQMTHWCCLQGHAGRQDGSPVRPGPWA